jgi:MoxR-like ATPase
VDALIGTLQPGLVPYTELNTIAEAVQESVRAELPLQNYAVNLWRALRNPIEAGVFLDDIDITTLVAGGASPRGMAMLMRAARCRAWLESRDYLTPDDIREVFHDTVSHRVFFNPAYELRRDTLAPQLLNSVIDKVPAP